MKNLVFCLAIVSFGLPAFAVSNCDNMAVAAVKAMRSVGYQSTQPLSLATVTANPKNTGNGVSLIVSFNNNSLRYLVLLMGEEPGPNPSCVAVHYVIEYPYADLINQ